MTDLSDLRLSVLDTAPVWQGTSATQALRHTTQLATVAERLGYHRYWVAEHHNAPSLVTSAPAVLISHIAAVTSRIRVGSGGVILPNHVPLVVAEQFGTLETLYPGRIDLGLGRSAGTDEVTARMLRRGLPADEFPRQIAQLLAFFTPTDLDSVVRALPANENRPPVWLLGSSPSSAQLAGLLGLPYAYAHQLNPAGTEISVATYRQSFRPSADLAAPYAIVAAFVLAAETDAEAHRLAGPLRLGYLQLHSASRTGVYPSQAEADSYRYTPGEKAAMDQRFGTQLFGSAETVRDMVADLVSTTGANELMALTMVPDHAQRVASHEILVEAIRSGRSASSPAEARA